MNCIIRTGNESGKESGAVELLKGRPMAYAGIAALTAAAIGWYFNGTVKLCLAAARSCLSPYGRYCVSHA